MHWSDDNQFNCIKSNAVKTFILTTSQEQRHLRLVSGEGRNIRRKGICD